MRIPAHAPPAVVLLLALESAPAAAAVIDVPVTPLIIRLYDARGLPGDHTGTAVEEARAILAEAGFAPEWVACGPPPSGVSRCATPLRGAELVVRVVEAPEERRLPDRLPLGYSLVDPQTKGGSFATIYVNRVLWLAKETGTDLGALLGRAIAHEIGHLLLGTPQHAHAGVMRAVWSREAVRGSRPDEWRFLAGDAKKMRAAARARAPR
jgi:hypothetical protein